ncbi:RNA polymerase II C-terminal domain phosphatase-like 1 isoform X2 [Diospyros lotus]|uniref:RNA polymerase II C-terminal domain phosphatase-like 1 isoform X2 n=1 Tax=Diospyros lotus TaxID=55363 RepID=UPI00225B07AE|nr:RNA polymerase II C-terminal domain phosphatase-like 1 isoform X2 [Diospyros lotus]
MYKSVVYEGDKLLGEVEVYPQNQNQNQNGGDVEIRISHFSQPSERCPPLAVLHTITSSGVCFKMESKSHSQDSPLYLLHSSCIRENKTAVILLGADELHLVAMPSRIYDARCQCFWGFRVASGLYDSCLVMLNLRCLGIVFDLDETLIVANTMRSFEDRIEALQRKINTEADPQRISGMLAEVKRYQDDKIILKQYAENDQVVENGKVVKSQSEVVPALSGNYQSIVRPLIRLQDKNIILTRINPLIRDTSVLVRLRPAWEDLRSYLTARGRKRFEVYVCTMAERDYALEMWRLLDPDSNLINSKELLDRIVCVKSGSRKSLFNVFQDGFCHPKMALVIDDRLKVWDEKDQPRVHVVPAFAPYYAPLAEANNPVPVLCVARNVACNVRGGFFKEFDEGLLQRISGAMYEDDIKVIPAPPDVSNYLISEDAISASSTVPNLDPRIPPVPYAVASSSISIPSSAFQGSSMPFPNKQVPQVAPVIKPLSQVGPPEASLQSSPAREEGEVPESELDPDTRRRLLILQHGQDTRDHAVNEPQFPVRPSIQVSVPRVQTHGSWFPVEEEMSPKPLNRVLPPKEFSLNSEIMHIEKHRPHYAPFIHKMEGSVPSERVLENQRLPKEALQREDRLRLSHSHSSYHSFSGEDVPLGRSSSSTRDLDIEPGRVDIYSETPAGALQDIATKCGTKVEFKPRLVLSTELQFLVEVLFSGEKVGEGIGKTRREAQHLAAEGSLKNLADKYLSRLKPDPSGDASSFGYQSLPKEEPPSFSSSSELPRILDRRLEGPKKSVGPVSALKELCMMEGLDFSFQAQPATSANPVQKNEVYAQVEVDGQVLGKGVGLTWDEAKMQAAEKALGNLKSTPGQFSQKRQSSPRLLQGMSNKRLKPEYSRVLQRIPSSARYPKNASSIP